MPAQSKEKTAEIIPPII